MINILKKPKKLFILLTIVVGLSFALSGIQSALVDVSAALHPIMFVSPESGLEFGMSFPQEERTAEFIVVGKNWHEKIYYGITLERKPLPDGYIGDGEDPDMPGYYRNLCPYLDAESEDEGEGDTMLMASVDAKDLGSDNLDYWLLKFDVPTIEGYVDQGFIGTPVDGPGEFGCDINIQFIHPCVEEAELVINGSFENPEVVSDKDWDIFDSSEVLGWSVEWVQAEGPYSGTDQPDEGYMELHRDVSGWASYEGEQHTELDSDWNDHVGDLSGEPASARIYQNIYTNPGYEYNIKFAFSPRPDTDANNNNLEFRWDGDVKDTISRAGSSDVDWSTHEYTFTATDWVTSLQFADMGDSDSLGTFLDDVSVTCIPQTECETGTQSFCSTGLGGVCESGTKLCDQNGNWGTCEPETSSTTEQCTNGVDDDCDGQTDSDDSDCDQPPAEECGNEIYEPNNNEQCDNGVANRDDMDPVWDQSQGGGDRRYCSTNCEIYDVPGTWCGDGIMQSDNESCDGTDGVTEGYTCTSGCTLQVVGVECSDLDDDGYSIEGGECGEIDCEDDDYDVNPGATEVCDNEKDDDCDGHVDGDDADCQPSVDCNPGQQRSCGTGNQGICSAGTQTCGTSGFWESCLQNESSTDEVCNGLDDDCDGTIDDGLSCGGGGGGGGGGILPLYIHHVSLALGSVPGSIDVTWYTNKASDSRVVYDTSSHPDPTDPPNYGYSYSTGTFDSDPKVTFHTVTVTGLSSGSPYYFRPVSAASPAVYGEEFTIILDAGTPPEEPPTPPTPPTLPAPPTPPTPPAPPTPPEPEGQVLGEEFEETTTPELFVEDEEEEGDVVVIAPDEQVPEEDGAEPSNNLYWWLLILILIILLILFWRKKRKKDDEK